MTYQELLKNSETDNILKMHLLKQEGKKIERVVINNPYAEEWLASKGIYAVGGGIQSYDSKGNISYSSGKSTENGLVYDLSVDFIAQHSGRLIRDDGDKWHEGLLSKSRKGRGYKYNSPLGYFGLLSRDKDQEFTFLEAKVFNTDDPRVDLSNYNSADFVNYIDDYRADMSHFKKLDNVFFHMSGLDVDLSSEMETTAAKVVDFGKQMSGIVVEGFANTFVGMGVGEEEVNIDWSKREGFDALDLAAEEYEIPLSDAQEENIRKSDFYKVSEGVSNFVPVIAEFALIEVGLKNAGAITGVPRLINNLTVGYRT